MTVNTPAAAAGRVWQSLPLTPTNWRVWRLVASVFPPVSIFDRISNPADLDAVYAVEALTNDRLRDEVGNINLVPVKDRVVGPGSTSIMAAFTHVHPDGGRYTDGTFGAYYASRDLDTAIAETKWHRARFLAATKRPAIDIDMRAYVAQLNGDLHDVRPLAANHPELEHQSDYSFPQSIGRNLRDSGSNGIVFSSVRRAGGINVAVYRPRLLSDCTQERHLTYRWDGNAIVSVYQKNAYIEG